MAQETITLNICDGHLKECKADPATLILGFKTFRIEEEKDEETGQVELIFTPVKGDFCPEFVKAYRAALAKLVDHMTAVRADPIQTSLSTGSAKKSTSIHDLAAIRKWRTDNDKRLTAFGLPQMPERGKTPDAILNAYYADTDIPDPR
jgi:hypothetical protein